jgi:hypothetical protein
MSMTDSEYEQKIAHAAGLTVMEFRQQGGRIVRCDCRGPLCREGWDVVFVSERGVEHDERARRRGQNKKK